MQRELDSLMPCDDEWQSSCRRWYAKQTHGVRYVTGDWHLDGEAHIFSTGLSPPRKIKAELRFGDHGAKRGFNICLFTEEQFDSDDKHELRDPRFHAMTQTIVGEANSTVVFRVYPFQVSRIQRLAGQLSHPDLQEFIDAHILTGLSLK